MKQLLSCLDREGERQGQTHRYRQTRTDTPSETGKNRLPRGTDRQEGMRRKRQGQMYLEGQTDRNRCTERNRDICERVRRQTDMCAERTARERRIDRDRCTEKDKDRCTE